MVPIVYVKNRRDGSRLLSSAIIVSIFSLIVIDHFLGKMLFIIAGLLSLYWWNCYKKLD
uniref:Phosphatidate cytidylyltransferase n=1 Tax=Paulinella longichromatophora TaxID=1708747 RepID=A0A2H4ZQ56_9EUKA|nr:hypothetical protein PLO_661 [Paulinella longichromatophora]